MREEQDENGKKNGQKSFFHLQKKSAERACAAIIGEFRTALNGAADL